LKLIPEVNSQGLRARTKKSSLKEYQMHDILVALAFVAMVACPAIVAALPQRKIEDEA
jgi:hypothetical protein